MITNYLFLNRELLDDVYSAHGSTLVVVQNRGDAVNFFNELLMCHKMDTESAMCSHSGLWISCKVSKTTVRSIRDQSFRSSIRGAQFTQVFTVGKMYEEDNELIVASLLWQPRQSPEE